MLQAQGTTTQPITFTSQNAQTAGTWSGLIFNSNAANSYLTHVWSTRPPTGAEIISTNLVTVTASTFTQHTTACT